MKRSFFALCLGWMLVFSATPAAARNAGFPPQAPNQDWEGLRLFLDKDIRVFTKNGKEVSGKLTGLTDDQLQLERKGKILDFRRDELQFVW
jgi:hypothetical protein